MLTSATVTLLLSLLAQPPPARDCSEVRAGNLEDGYVRCAGLPFEVRFAGETKLERFAHLYDFSEGTIKRTASTVDAAGLVHRAFGYDSPEVREKAVAGAIADALNAVSPKPAPEVVSRAADGDWSTVRFRAQVEGKPVQGEVRARYFRGHAIALFVWAPQGGKYAPGSTAAKAFFSSFRPVDSAVRVRMGVVPDMDVSLPPGTWSGGWSDVYGFVVYPFRFSSIAAIAGLDRDEDFCDRVKDLPSALTGADFLKLESPKMTPVQTAAGKGFLVEGALTNEAGKWATNYLFCNGKTAPIRVMLFTAQPSPEAVAFVREVAESATGPAKMDLQFRVAMTGNYWPLHAHDDVGCYGLEMDLAGLLAKEFGKEQATCYPRSSLNGLSPIEAVAKGKVHVALSAITPTDERRKLVDFTEPYLILQYRLLRRDAAEVTGAAELSGKTIAIPAGTAETVLRPVLGAATVTVSKSLGEALKLLREKKVDYVAAEDVALIEVAELPAEALTGPALAPSPIAMAVPKGQLAKYAPLLTKLRPELEKLRQQFRAGAAPTELGITTCEGESPAWTTLDLSTFQFKDTEPASSAAWWAFDPDSNLCVTEAFRRTSEAPPRKQRSELRKRISAELKTLSGGKPRWDEKNNYEVRRGTAVAEWEKLETWVRLPGVWLNLMPFREERTCVAEGEADTVSDWDCSVVRYVVSAIRGEQIVMKVLPAEFRATP
jgi:polar amino acid transport system substrate-binding protein